MSNDASMQIVQKIVRLAYHAVSCENLRPAQRCLNFTKQFDIETFPIQLLISIGDLAEKQGEIDYAIRCYKSALKGSRIEQSLAVTLGQLLMSRGRYEEAINVFEQLLAQDEYSGSIRYYLEEARHHRVRLVEALEQYVQTFEFHGPQSTDTHRCEGLVFLLARQYDSAIEMYQQVLEGQTSQPDVFYEIAVAFMLTEQLDQAQYYFEKALAVDPEHDRAQMQLAHLLAIQGENQRSAELVRETLLRETNRSTQLSYPSTAYSKGRARAKRSCRLILGQKNAVPIVLIHRNMDIDPLVATPIAYSLAQARKSNKASEIYLISDAPLCSSYVKNEYIADYYSSAHQFGCVYQHITKSVRYDYLVFCFQRWFILKEFMLEKGLTRCAHIDSDVMLFSNLTDVDQQTGDFEFKMSAHPHFGVSGHCNIVSNYSVLDKFCSFVLDIYSNPPERGEGSVMKHAVWHSQEGYVTDMMAFQEFWERGYCTLFNLSEIFDDSTFDANINSSDGFEMSRGMKNIHWYQDQAFCRQVDSGHEIRFHGLHFNGPTKKYMRNAFLHQPLDTPV